jgi:hypothetical protein
LLNKYKKRIKVIKNKIDKIIDSQNKMNNLIIILEDIEKIEDMKKLEILKNEKISIIGFINSNLNRVFNNKFLNIFTKTMNENIPLNEIEKKNILKKYFLIDDDEIINFALNNTNGKFLLLIFHNKFKLC